MRHGATPGFIVREKDSTWGRAIKVVGPAGDWTEGVGALSCSPRDGTCTLAGGYASHKLSQAFVT
jgi:hypothetical protein